MRLTHAAIESTCSYRVRVAPVRVSEVSIAMFTVPEGVAILAGKDDP